MMEKQILFLGLHHGSLIVENLEKALYFYCDVLGLQVNSGRPDMAYDGAWLDVGAQQIHLLNLEKTEQAVQKIEHVGRDRHLALHVNDIQQIASALDSHQITYTMSRSGRQALFCRDPDGNGLEFICVPVYK